VKLGFLAAQKYRRAPTEKDGKNRMDEDPGTMKPSLRRARFVSALIEDGNFRKRNR
jgi:hypothetical protein